MSELKGAEMEPRELIETAIEAVRAHDMERIDGLLEDEFMFEDMPTGARFHKLDGMRQLLAETWEVFPDYHLLEPRVNTGEGFIVLEAVVAGTHSAPHFGVSPSGREVRFRACLVYELGPEGRIRRERYYYDVEGLRRALEAA